MERLEWKRVIPTIAQREGHIIHLARIVAAKQGEPTRDAIEVVIEGNPAKVDTWYRYACGHEYDEGDAQWNARLAGEAWRPICRECLPGEIEAGEAVLDRRSAHETLAAMLCGREGRRLYLSYFHPEPSRREEL